MKKVFAVVLSLCVLMGLCAGCGPEEVDDGSVELVFSTWGSGAEKKLLEQVIDQFEKENPGIRVRINSIPSDYMTKMTAMAAGNALPDVGYFGESAVLKWAENGMLMDLTEMFESEDMMAKKLDTVQFVSKDGKVVGASVANEVPVLFYNKDLFDEAGLPYPPSTAEDAWTWDEFVEVAKKLTKDAAGNTADSPAFDPSYISTYGALIPANDLFFNTLMWSNGGGFVAEDNKTILLDKPESVEALQAMADLIYKHHVSPTPSNQSSMPVLTSALLGRSVAMYFGLQYELMSLADAKEKNGLNYGIGVLPVFKEPVGINGGSPIVIFSSTKHPEESKKLMAYLMDPENMLPLINEGLWMPNEEQWYTDPAYTERWIVEDVHTAEYQTAVVDFTMQYGRQNPYFTCSDIPEMEATILPTLGRVFAGEIDAQTAVNEIMPGLKKYIEENR